MTTARRGRNRPFVAALTLLVGWGAGIAGAHASLIVDPSASGDAADELAGSLLGPGINLVGSPTFTGVDNQAGRFRNGSAAGLGIDRGAIMTSGDARLAPGPNAADNRGALLGTSGDPELDDRIDGTTRDAAVLAFDFQFGDGSGGGDLFLDFIFASEEYNENVGSSFDDAMSVMIDGVEIALAPDGSSISVNNINCGPDGRSAGPNCTHFNNNDPSDSSAPFDLEYDGFTDALTAQQLGLGPGTHSARLAIADAGAGGDFYLDSALLLGERSFSSTSPRAIAVPATPSLFGGGLLLLAGAAARRHSPRGKGYGRPC